MSTSGKSPSQSNKGSKKPRSLVNKSFTKPKHSYHVGASKHASKHTHLHQEIGSTISDSRHSHGTSTTSNIQSTTSSGFDEDTTTTSVFDLDAIAANALTAPGYGQYSDLSENDLMGIGAWTADYGIPAAGTLSLDNTTPSESTQTTGETHRGVRNWAPCYDVSSPYNTPPSQYGQTATEVEVDIEACTSGYSTFPTTNLNSYSTTAHGHTEINIHDAGALYCMDCIEDRNVKVEDWSISDTERNQPVSPIS
ncbi:hypothetical protein VTL71DRAFT_2190 [Oculimacula yallundae]|uniref:Uncharacterized protein n=1 Tax=Oculimacula yallundae TaxID=86028 RepID=A0ABR4C8B2_9HELO